jgi:hypothetical protein
MRDEDYERLVHAKVLKKKPAVPCPSVRTLSTCVALSTSRSLVEPLKNTLDFFRNAPAITRTMVASDAEAAANIIYNVIDGLNDST